MSRVTWKVTLALGVCGMLLCFQGLAAFAAQDTLVPLTEPGGAPDADNGYNCVSADSDPGDTYTYTGTSEVTSVTSIYSTSGFSGGSPSQLDNGQWTFTIKTGDGPGIAAYVVTFKGGKKKCLIFRTETPAHALQNFSMNMATDGTLNLTFTIHAPPGGGGDKRDTVKVTGWGPPARPQTPSQAPPNTNGGGD